MFIVSKKNFKIHRKNGEVYKIPKDFAGNIPDDVASSWLVQAAIQSGSIVASKSTKDKDVYKADEEAEKKAQAADIRPDAKCDQQTEKPETEEPEEVQGEKKTAKGRK